jgi:5-carboxymethyl-2-hydroxymuconate isomerase
MPHITLEYSANLEDRVDVPKLVRTVHAAALATGHFEEAAIRTRGERREVYCIADLDPANAFLSVSIRLARGRSVETRQAIARRLFDAIAAELYGKDPNAPVALNLEVFEIDEPMMLRKNNIAQVMAGRARKAG